jgi:2'-5' RNA ligase
MMEAGLKDDRRALLDAKLTELGLYAKELCPDGAVEMSTTRYEDEDGHVTLVVPPQCSEDDEDRIELALAARAGRIFEDTGLFILCGVLDQPPD